MPIKETKSSSYNSQISFAYYDGKYTHVFFRNHEYIGNYNPKTSRITFNKKETTIIDFITGYLLCGGLVLTSYSPFQHKYPEVFREAYHLFGKQICLLSYLETVAMGIIDSHNGDSNFCIQFEDELMWGNAGDGVIEIRDHVLESKDTKRINKNENGDYSYKNYYSDGTYETINCSYINLDENSLENYLISGMNKIFSIIKGAISDTLLLSTCLQKIIIGTYSENGNVRDATEVIGPDCTIPTKKTIQLFLNKSYGVFIDCDGEKSDIPYNTLVNFFGNDIDNISITVDINARNIIQFELRDKDLEKTIQFDTLFVKETPK